MIAHVLRRLGALVSGPPRVDLTAVPPGLLRDVGLADIAPARIGPARIGTAPRSAPGREGVTAQPKRPFSFRIHPVSEMVEIGERSALASLPEMRHNGAHPLAA